MVPALIFMTLKVRRPSGLADPSENLHFGEACPFFRAGD
jgi:hypothetical protein